MTRRRLLLITLLVAASLTVAAAALITLRRADRQVMDLAADSSRVLAPAGTRIRVQVLNATSTRGLARRATLHLRDRGFDVVEIGTSPEQLDSTVVIARSGNRRWAELVAAALEDSLAGVLERPDTSRYLDITVLLGRSWRPPAEPFYP
jgi:hypothetical protein